VRNRTFLAILKLTLVAFVVAVIAQYATYSLALQDYTRANNFPLSYDNSLLEPTFLHPHTSISLYVLCYGIVAVIVTGVLCIGGDVRKRDRNNPAFIFN
jgi:hypothetical protein